MPTPDLPASIRPSPRLSHRVKPARRRGEERRGERGPLGGEEGWRDTEERNGGEEEEKRREVRRVEETTKGGERKGEKSKKKG